MSRGPLPRRTAWRGVGRSVLVTARLLVAHRLHQPTLHVGQVLAFADGSRARVYRETTVDRATHGRAAPAAPAVLVVSFRLRGVRGAGHAAFRVESLLNTPLFVGFPGFVSKLWLAHDREGRYRGVYEWDGAGAAETYARSLWRVLALVSEPGSIDYQVLPGLRREEVLADPRLLAAREGDADVSWWRVVGAA